MPKKPKGDPEIAKFFRDVRYGCGYEGKKVFAFADAVGIDGTHLWRIEKKKALPGPDILAKIYPYVIQAQLTPSHLMYLWLEAQGLKTYVAELKAAKLRDSK